MDAKQGSPSARWTSPAAHLLWLHRLLLDRLLPSLIAAAKRGVKVEIIVPGKHIDQRVVRAASKRHWPDLLQTGIKIYEYQPTMVHVKLLVVDDAFVSVGSGNFDNRSVRLNDEANLDVLDRQFAAEQTRLFEKDKRESREMMLDPAGKFTGRLVG